MYNYIYKTLLRRKSWYDKYRIKDEETIKKVNDIWEKIIIPEELQ